MRLLAAAFTCGLIAGCGDSTPPPIVAGPTPAVAAAPVAPPPPPPPQFTKIEWRAAYSSIVEASGAKADGEGVTEYGACLERESEKKCNVFFFGKADGFKKIDYLTPAWSQLNEIGNIYTYTRIYIAAKECDAPSILISPTVNERGSWLFLRKAAFMADGNVVLERDFEHHNVDRDNDRGFIHERSTWLASPADVEALRSIAKANSTITRFTGDTKYLTIGKKRQQEFVEDVQTVLSAYDKLNEALSKAGGPKCS